MGVRVLLLGLLACGLLLTACAEMDVPLPLPVSGGGNTLLREDFVLGRTANWQLEADDVGRTMIVPEQLVIEVNEPYTMQFASLAEPTFTDFVLEVDARQLAGNPEGSFGVLFRMQSPQEFYRFEMTGNGMYMLERRDADGQWTRLMPEWRDSSAIQQGLEATNRLRVMARGPQLAIYVNDTLLHEVTDDRYGSGTIALDAGTFGATGLQVAFDNLLIYPPN